MSSCLELVVVGSEGWPSPVARCAVGALLARGNLLATVLVFLTALILWQAPLLVCMTPVCWPNRSNPKNVASNFIYKILTISVKCEN